MHNAIHLIRSWPVCLFFAMGVGNGWAAPVTPSTQPLAPLKTLKGRVVDGADRDVVLRGVNLGQWLLLEMWQFPEDVGVPDQQSMQDVLTRRFGRDEGEALMDLWREHWLGDRDFALMKEFGINFVRVPFEYQAMEDDAKPMALKPAAFKWLDRAIELAERHDMYVLLDLHGAAGRQSEYQHSGQQGVNRFWKDPQYPPRALWLWRQIAERYKGRASVIGYELLNEPWGAEPAQLRDLAETWYAQMRAIDEEKILVLPGMAIDPWFYRSPKELGWKNVMVDMHFYPGLFGWDQPRPQTHATFLRGGLNEFAQRLAEWETPLLHGEMNLVYKRAGGGEMTRHYMDFYRDKGWAFALWTWKVLKSEAGIGDASWGLVVNQEQLPALNFNTSRREEIEAYFRSMSTIPLAVDRDLQHWMTTPQSPRSLEELVRSSP